MGKGIEHTISPKDIPLPTHCVYMGYELCYEMRTGGIGGLKPNSATVDRIDSSLGYVPDNIQVISWQANRAKSNLTEDQLLAFAYGILRTHEK